MEETGIDGEVLREICDLAEKYHIQKVILFGSRARGDFKRTSDIDLAVEGGEVSLRKGNSVPYNFIPYGNHTINIIFPVFSHGNTHFQSPRVNFSTIS